MEKRRKNGRMEKEMERKRTGVEDAWRIRKAAAVEKRAVDGDGQRCGAQCAVRWPSVIRTKRVVPCDVPGSLAPLLGAVNGQACTGQERRSTEAPTSCLAHGALLPRPAAQPAQPGQAHPPIHRTPKANSELHLTVISFPDAPARACVCVSASPPRPRRVLTPPPHIKPTNATKPVMRPNAHPAQPIQDPGHMNMNMSLQPSTTQIPPSHVQAHCAVYGAGCALLCVRLPAGVYPKTSRSLANSEVPWWN